MIGFGFVLALAVFFGLAVFLRAVASSENPKFVVIVPPNMQAIVTTKSNDATDLTKGGGNVTNIIHSIPGKKLIRDSPDQMEWHYTDERELRGLLYHLLGIQFIWFFRGLLLNDVRTFRFGRGDTESIYRIMAKSMQARYVFFSGQHDIQIDSVETVGILKVNIRLNVIYETTYPVRVLLRTADPFAVMTMMVTRLVIGMVGGIEPQILIRERARQDELAREIERISPQVEQELGLTLKRVTVADISFDPDTQELLELQRRTDLENEARLAVADNAKQVQIRKNDADADRIERVIKPAAQDDRTVSVKWAEAYQGNAVVTTYAPGTDKMLPIKQ